MNESAEFKLLNGYQRDFPIEPAPFARLAQETGLEERAVIERLAQWVSDGTVSRVGPVLKPGALGTSTLAAMKVPEADLERIAEIVNAFPEVNHNYEREAELNLWFVATASSEGDLTRVLKDIERRTGIPVLDLRLEEEFRIDLGFDLRGGSSAD